MNRLFIPLPGNEEFARPLAASCDGKMLEFTFHQFPDGETYIQTTDDIAGADTILVCTLERPNEKFLPLYLLASHLREMGAARIGLVAPYLAYLRQDRRFKPGEALTSKLFARLLSNTVDWLVTVDPHLHRYRSLAEIYTVPAHVAHAAPAISSWIRRNVADPVVIGPDVESKQWVEAVAAEADAPYTILTKTRRGDRDIAIDFHDRDVLHARTPVLVDDIVSTARTMIETVKHLNRLKSQPTICIGVHAIFAGNAYDELERAAVTTIATCNTIPHRSNRIDVIPELAKVLEQALDHP